MDRGYFDFARLHTISNATAFFVIRGKTNFKYRRVFSHPVNSGDRDHLRPESDAHRVLFS